MAFTCLNKQTPHVHFHINLPRTKSSAVSSAVSELGTNFETGAMNDLNDLDEVKAPNTYTAIIKLIFSSTDLYKKPFLSYGSILKQVH